MKFNEIETIQIKEAIWESLDQFSKGKPILNLIYSDMELIFTKEEFETRMNILMKIGNHGTKT